MEQVAAALAYYRDFPREIDAELARDPCAGLVLFDVWKAEALRGLASRAAESAQAGPLAADDEPAGSTPRAPS